MSDPSVEKIVREAFSDFALWCRKHDPEGNMDILEAVNAYAEWCNEEARAAIAKAKGDA